MTWEPSAHPEALGQARAQLARARCNCDELAAIVAEFLSQAAAARSEGPLTRRAEVALRHHRDL